MICQKGKSGKLPHQRLLYYYHVFYNYLALSVTDWHSAWLSQSCCWDLIDVTRAIKNVSSKLVDVVDVIKLVLNEESTDNRLTALGCLASAWQQLFTVELFVWFPVACFETKVVTLKKKKTFNSRVSCAVSNILWICYLFWNFLSDVFDKSWFFLAVVSFWLAFIRLYDTWRCAKYHVDVEKVDATTCHYKCFLGVTMPNFAL